MLAPASQACISAAHRLYGGILDEIERMDNDVFQGRARVPKSRRLAVAAGAVLTAKMATTSGKLWPQRRPEAITTGKL